MRHPWAGPRPRTCPSAAAEHCPGHVSSPRGSRLSRAADTECDSPILRGRTITDPAARDPPPIQRSPPRCSGTVPCLACPDPGPPAAQQPSPAKRGEVMGAETTDMPPIRHVNQRADRKAGVAGNLEKILTHGSVPSTGAWSVTATIARETAPICFRCIMLNVK